MEPGATRSHAPLPAARGPVRGDQQGGGRAPLRQLDQLQRAEQLEEPQLSPRTPTQEEVQAQLSPRHQQLLAWLAHLPDPVVEDVVRELLASLEGHLLEDINRKLVLAIINTAPLQH